MRLLLADDERELANALGTMLKHHKYTVDIVYNGQDALDYAMSQDYDCVILDIMMPKINGLEVIKAMRDKNITAPVLLLTALSEVDDRIKGLDAGADDYLPKPFNSGELLARVRALTRRAPTFTPDIISFGSLTLDNAGCTLSCGKSSIELNNKEFQVLQLLMSNPNQLIPAERIMDRVWGYDSSADISVVWVYISNLRKKLRQLNSGCEIKAVRSVGYMIKEGDTQ